MPNNSKKNSYNKLKQKIKKAVKTVPIKNLSYPMHTVIKLLN